MGEVGVAGLASLIKDGIGVNVGVAGVVGVTGAVVAVAEAAAGFGDETVEVVVVANFGKERVISSEIVVGAVEGDTGAVDGAAAGDTGALNVDGVGFAAWSTLETTGVV